MTAALRLAFSLVASLLMWLPTVPAALEANEDPARLAGRYLLALLIARIGVGLVFRVVGSYVEPEEANGEDETPEAAIEEEEQPAPRRRRDDLATGAGEQELFHEALDEVDQTAALVP